MRAEIKEGKWRERALCQEQLTSTFFVIDEELSRRVADKICGPCPVKDECLEYALSISGGVDGVWGGTTEKQRQKERRKLQRLARQQAS